jgi:glycerol-3-phosphate acyltransferase PlsY
MCEVDAVDPNDLGVILGAYFTGSIPFSQLIAHWRTGLNVHEVGEGNVGSRNVWHVAGPRWGLLAALLDCVKGYLVYRVASALAPPVVALLAGVAVVLGHRFSIVLRGRGGKGLAIGLRVLLGLSPLSTLSGLIVLGVAFLILRDFNPSVTIAIVAIILLPILFRQPLWVSVYAVDLSLLAALKKRLDRPHETEIWRSHPWQGAATPGWQNPANQASGESTSPDARPN